jgi:hypothetical protein
MLYQHARVSIILCRAIRRRPWHYVNEQWTHPGRAEPSTFLILGQLYVRLVLTMPTLARGRNGVTPRCFKTFYLSL